MRRICHSNRVRSALLASCMLVAPGLLASIAGADNYPLTESVDGATHADFGMVRIAEDGTGGLIFEVSLNPDVLGSDADLHCLYFNLAGSHSRLAGETDDDYESAYELLVAPSVAGGAGTSFDYAVDFGKGASKRGNGTLQRATFKLFSHGGNGLTAMDPQVDSRTRVGTDLHVAVHIQGSDYSTVGGSRVDSPPPEPDDEPAPQPDPDPCSVFTCVPSGI